MTAVRFLALIALAPCLPSAAQSAKTKCSVVVVDVDAANAFFEKPPANTTPEELQAAAGKFVRVLGEFQPDPGEEVLTTKSYPLPGTKLTVTASVYYTDESMPGDSATLGIFVGSREVPDATRVQGGVAAETNLTSFTFLMRAKARVAINSRPHALKLECQNMTMDEYSDRIEAYKDFQKKAKPPK